jgi:hypothetical protein
LVELLVSDAGVTAATIISDCRLACNSCNNLQSHELSANPNPMQILCESFSSSVLVPSLNSG